MCLGAPPVGLPNYSFGLANDTAVSTLTFAPNAWRKSVMRFVETDYVVLVNV
jgi:hypothetical protein